MFSIIGSCGAVQASIVDNLASPTLKTSSSLGFVDVLVNLLLNKVLGPLFSFFGGGDKDDVSKSVPNTDSSKTQKQPPKKQPIKEPTKNQQPTKSENTQNTNKNYTSGSLAGKVIVIDPGHGGYNPGAVANGVHEADVNLAISLKVRDKLAKSGAKVVMTRQSDVQVSAEGNRVLSEELAARVRMAHNANADIFVSIHANANEKSSAVGAMTFYYSDKSTTLARKIQDGIIKATGAVDKGIATESFHVIRNTNMPSVLVETGFITNPNEAALLSNNNYQNKVADGIYNGIVQYFKG